MLAAWSSTTPASQSRRTVAQGGPPGDSSSTHQRVQYSTAGKEQLYSGYCYDIRWPRNPLPITPVKTPPRIVAASTNRRSLSSCRDCDCLPESRGEICLDSRHLLRLLATRRHTVQHVSTVSTVSSIPGHSPDSAATRSRPAAASALVDLHQSHTLLQ